MLFVFSRIFVADTKITFSHNFIAPVSKYTVNTSLCMSLSDNVFLVKSLSFIILTTADNINYGLFLVHFEVDFKHAGIHFYNLPWCLIFSETFLIVVDFE